MMLVISMCTLQVIAAGSSAGLPCPFPFTLPAGNGETAPLLPVGEQGRSREAHQGDQGALQAGDP